MAGFAVDVPGRQFVDTVDRVVGDAGEHLGQVGLRIEAVQFGGFDDGVDGGGALAAFLGAGEQPVLSSQGEGADGVFGGVPAPVL